MLRNVSGSHVRDLIILYHNLCIVGTIDKTSHQYLRNNFVPHCPTYDISHELICNLALFRPFERTLVHFFKGQEAGNRFHLYLWPRYHKDDIVDGSTAGGYNVSRMLGAATERYIGVELKILKYRHIVSTFMRQHSDPRLFEISKQYFFDIMQNHNTTTSYLKYGLDHNSMANSDPRHILGCIKTSIAWHTIANIGQKHPLRTTVDDADTPLVSNGSIAPNTDSQQATSFAVPSGLDLMHFSNAIANAGRLQQEMSIRDTLTTIMADLVPRYFGPPPPPRPAEALRQCSTIFVHPQRIQHLREFLGDPHATFRHPEQAELVEKMQSRQNHILAILPCGTGKTFMMLFQAKMYDSDKVMVIILPLSGLHSDFCRRARAL
ncbi:hypothetical protein EW146_g9677, partial [Bondarzewia mesenterica]